jgi:5-oxoprolinase (ATP-hydrolysing)
MNRPSVNSYYNRRLARDIRFEHISVSHKLMPMIKLVPRAISACADTCLTPAIKKYIAGSRKGFEGDLSVKGLKNLETKGARCDFMQSDGGLVDVNQFSGLKAILSGPAGGIVGYSHTSYDPRQRSSWDLNGGSDGWLIYAI